MTDVVDQLRKVRELLTSKNNWRKGGERGKRELEDGRVVTTYCLVGAIREAAGGYPDMSVMDLGAYKVLQAALPPRGAGLRLLSFFNDETETKHEDVLRAIDNAILLAETKVS